MDILVAAIIVIILAAIVHSLFWALIFFILGCAAVALFRAANGSRRL